MEGPRSSRPWPTVAAALRSLIARAYAMVTISCIATLGTLTRSTFFNT
jgi:hypothetical protein